METDKFIRITSELWKYEGAPTESNVPTIYLDNPQKKFDLLLPVSDKILLILDFGRGKPRFLTVPIEKTELIFEYIWKLPWKSHDL